MKTGLSLTALAQEIESRASAKKDLIAPAPKMEAIAIKDDSDNTKVLLRVEGHDAMHANGLAHNQLAEYVGIPAAYYKRMQAEQPELLARNINAWLQSFGGKDLRMVRTLGGQVRAVLSDKYRAVENEDLAEAILPVLLQRNLVIMSCQVTDTRMYIKAVDRNIEANVPTGHKMGDGSHTIFDTLSPAIIISNSEVGHGALSIETGVYTKACTNMALFGASMRKYHTGARAELSDDLYALWSQTKDLVAAAFDQVNFEALAKKIGEASQDKIEAEVGAVEVVERIGKRFDLSQGERKGVLASLIEGADLSRYGVHSAVTHFSAKIEDYDRATDLERLGGKIIELNRSEWQQLAA